MSQIPLDSTLSLSLDSQSAWATIRGRAAALNVLEDSLAELLRIRFPRCRQRLKPWLRTEDGAVSVLAGLLPVAVSGLAWPVVKLRDETFTERMKALEAAGWRDYQREAVLRAVKAPLGRGIVSVGTGGGKTRIAAGIAYMCGGQWIYTVHGRDLISEARKSFDSLGELLGSPLPIHCHSWGKIPSDLLQSASGLLADEVHEAGARTRALQVERFMGSYRIGLSSTPLERSDARNPLVLGLFGEPVFTLSVRELTEQGSLTPGKVVMVRL